LKKSKKSKKFFKLFAVFAFFAQLSKLPALLVYSVKLSKSPYCKALLVYINENKQENPPGILFAIILSANR